MSSWQDYYSILNVPKTASAAAIKKAYRDLAKKNHPDRFQDPKEKENAGKKFQEIQHAYDVLGDENKRRAYDAYGHEAFERGAGGGGGSAHGFEDFFSGFQSGGFSDIFGDFFSQFSGEGGKRAVRGEDLKYSIEISLEQAFKGTKLSIKIPKMVSCKPCNGRGGEVGSTGSRCSMCNGSGQVRMQQLFLTVRQACPQCGGAGTTQVRCKSCKGEGRLHERCSIDVNVPAGVSDGMQLRLQGEGNSGPGGAGDLFIHIKINPHSLFKVESGNIVCDVPISVPLAVLGGEIEVPTIDGNKIKISVPAGTQPGNKLKVKGRGMPSVRSSGRGDMIVNVEVEIPTSTSSKEKELWKSLLSESKEGNKSTSFFTRVRDFLAKF